MSDRASMGVQYVSGSPCELPLERIVPKELHQPSHRRDEKIKNHGQDDVRHHPTYRIRGVHPAEVNRANKCHAHVTDRANQDADRERPGRNVDRVPEIGDRRHHQAKQEKDDRKLTKLAVRRIAVQFDYCHDSASLFSIWACVAAAVTAEGLRAIIRNDPPSRWPLTMRLACTQK